MTPHPHRRSSPFKLNMMTQHEAATCTRRPHACAVVAACASRPSHVNHAGQHCIVTTIQKQTLCYKSMARVLVGSPTCTYVIGPMYTTVVYMTTINGHHRIDRDTATRRRRRACDDSRGHGRGRTRREPGRACASETHATPRREATGDDGWRRTKGGARGRRRATTERAARDERGARTGRATRKRER